MKDTWQSMSSSEGYIAVYEFHNKEDFGMVQGQESLLKNNLPSEGCMAVYELLSKVDISMYGSGTGITVKNDLPK